MKRGLAMLLAAMLLAALPPSPGGRAEADYRVADRKTEYEYRSDTLTYTMESCKVNGTKCYLTVVWVQDPARQIRKAASPWHKALATAEELTAKIEGAALAINGSGYVSPRYPWIPADYPGESADYYYTPLGSLTVTDGEVLRDLPGVAYTGLTLEKDGLHMYVGADNGEVLSREPIQTWAFYGGCPMALDGEDILDHDWDFANVRAVRTILAKLREENTWLILTATSIHGLTLTEANAFLLGEFDTEWIYDLDGGPSSALLRRKMGKKKPVRMEISHSTQKIVDIMAFTE